MRRYLDALGDDHLGDDKTFTDFLRDKLIQSEGPAPAFVDPAWLSTPDVIWRQAGPVPVPMPKRVYQFADARRLPSVDAEYWLTALRTNGVSGAGLRVAEALVTFGDYGTGREVRPANGTVAAALGLTRETVNRKVKAFRSEGWLIPTGKGAKGVIVYALAVPEPVAVAA